jgi:hypothetical protein
MGARRAGAAVTACIGPSDGSAGDYFYVTVCSPKWFDAHLLDEGIGSGEHVIFMRQYSYSALRKYIEERIDACEGDNWEPLARKLARLARCLQLFNKTFTLPFKSRLTITESSPVLDKKKSPGFGSWLSWPTNNHARAKIRPSSVR